ncbi:MAG: sulfotransferase domain-containing protein [Deltaproteobacteria bacterium]|nr:sulfotransferase domain-containing protein [Deltaproteobacteria bacterium]MBW2415261.1 sulfotransferase domain-containing protein [Deltaproteobacteria bacterium]
MLLPRPTRVYQNHHLDSKRWDGFQPRPDDIIVTTSYKSGTTFTQQILLHMLRGHEDPLPRRETVSPWLDARFHPSPIQEVLAGLESQTDRRFIKSHLPLDGLPYFEEVQYLVVARDPRDVFMSFSNHYGNYTDAAFEAANGGDRRGAPLPPFEPDVHRRFRDWITRGWFEWESEGWPFWSNMHHTQTYWDHRQLPNLAFLHYADMLADLDGTVRRIAGIIGHDLSDDDLARIVRGSRFDTMKRAAAEEDEVGGDEPRMFAGGESAFIYKGTNGRWKGVLDDEDLALYEQAKDRVLTPDCAEWLENGGKV